MILLDILCVTIVTWRWGPSERRTAGHTVGHSTLLPMLGKVRGTTCFLTRATSLMGFQNKCTLHAKSQRDAFLPVLFRFEIKWKNFRSRIEWPLLEPSKITPRELCLHFCATNQQFEYMKVPCHRHLWLYFGAECYDIPTEDPVKQWGSHSEHSSAIMNIKLPRLAVWERQRIHISCILTSLNYKAAAIYTKRDTSKGKNSEDSLQSGQYNLQGCHAQDEKAATLTWSTWFW